MFGMRVKERQITFDNCSVANMLQRLFPTWHASTLPPFFPGFQSHLIILFNPAASFGHRALRLRTPTPLTKN